jgi:hypothetical protein
MSHPQNGQPARLPIVVRSGDLRALADRLESCLADDSRPQRSDLQVAVRLARHAATVWVGRSAVSI